jgi:group I intron endonuclease
MSSNCGIYQIKNTLTGDYYIGSSSDLRHRIHCHHSELARNKHCNSHLQHAYNKYGEQAFEFNVLLLCSIENKLYYEQVLLDNLKPAYNIAVCATANMQGLRLSDESRAKMSAARKGERHPNFGKHLSEETRAKISEANKGQLGNMLGKHHSEATCAKISAARKGYILSEEHKCKLSEANFGKHPSDETRAKMSETQKVRWMKRSAA